MNATNNTILNKQQKTITLHRTSRLTVGKNRIMTDVTSRRTSGNTNPRLFFANPVLPSKIVTALRKCNKTDRKNKSDNGEARPATQRHGENGGSDRAGHETKMAGPYGAMSTALFVHPTFYLSRLDHRLVFHRGNRLLAWERDLNSRSHASGVDTQWKVHTMNNIKCECQVVQIQLKVCSIQHHNNCKPFELYDIAQAICRR